MDRDVLKRRLEQRPLPARAWVLMTTSQLELLSFHHSARSELQRRHARKQAKQSGRLEALIATSPIRPDPKVKDADLKEKVEELFAA